MEFHDKIKLLLTKRQKTQKEFADKYGVQKGTVSHWFSGRCKPDFKQLLNFSEFFNVPVEYLLDNDVTAIPNSTFDVNAKHVPLINWVQAGAMTEVVADGYEQIPVPIETPDGCFALTVHGKSMEPNFIEGDIIIVDPNQQPTSGKFVVAATKHHEKATFKKYRERYTKEGNLYFELVPLNTDFATFDSTQMEIEIIGVVRSFIRKL